MSVYFIQAGASGPIKIGVATDVPRRLKEISTGCPDEPILLGSITGDFALEQRIHRHLKKAQRRFEWFNPTKEVLGFIDLCLQGSTAEEIEDELRKSEVDHDLGLAEMHGRAPLLKLAAAIGAALTVAKFGFGAVVAHTGIGPDRLKKLCAGETDSGFTALVRLIEINPRAFGPYFAVAELDESNSEDLRRSLEEAKDAIEGFLDKLKVRAA